MDMQKTPDFCIEMSHEVTSMPTDDLYEVTSVSISDKMLYFCLMELLLERIENEPPHLCADCTSSL